MMFYVEKTDRQSNCHYEEINSKQGILAKKCTKLVGAVLPKPLSTIIADVVVCVNTRNSPKGQAYLSEIGRQRNP